MPKDGRNVVAKPKRMGQKPKRSQSVGAAPSIPHHAHLQRSEDIMVRTIPESKYFAIHHDGIDNDADADHMVFDDVDEAMRVWRDVSNRLENDPRLQRNAVAFDQAMWYARYGLGEPKR